MTTSYIIWTVSIAITSAIVSAVATFLFLRANKNKAAILDKAVKDLRNS